MTNERSKDIQTSVHTSINHEVNFTNNAPHHFRIVDNEGMIVSTVDFQNGGINEVGVNGVMNEDLLHMVKIRLEHFQDSPYACEENGEALEYVNAAIKELAKRTQKRQDRGVEGTHVI